MAVRLDRINLALLHHLQRDARTTVADLARRLERSETTVRERVETLEREGYVQGYRALVDTERMGLRSKAVVRAAVGTEGAAALAQRLGAIPEVTSAFLTTGAKPVLLHLVSRDIEQLLHTLESRIAGLSLQSVETETVLQTLVQQRPPVLAELVSGPAMAAGRGIQAAARAGPAESTGRGFPAAR
jgi:DNA-binding Lrp family transcriptional regulator